VVPVVLSVVKDRFREVVQAVVQAGLVVDQELPTSGVVTGEVPEERLSAVAAVDGGESVERERTIHLPPPDSSIQ